MIHYLLLAPLFVVVVIVAFISALSATLVRDDKSSTALTWVAVSGVAGVICAVAQISASLLWGMLFLQIGVIYFLART